MGKKKGRLLLSDRWKSIYDGMLEGYQKLEQKDVNEITYEEFAPRDWRSFYSTFSVDTNFDRFAKEHIAKLIKVDILKLHPELGRNYLKYNPNPRPSKPAELPPNVVEFPKN